MCGVLPFIAAFCARRWGSSPRVRGFGIDALRYALCKRFIPACAGFWGSSAAPARTPWVHPRVCGVLKVLRMYAPPLLGSSPRVRGFVVLAADDKTVFRFIPACAGFWARSAHRGRRAKVHPRVCGVLLPDFRTDLRGLGSSPRVRGFDTEKRDYRQRYGFIPACAGFCNDLSRHFLASWVHPRVCGVLLRPSPRRVRICGSSPRVRGFVPTPRNSLPRPGFIPACAGFCSACQRPGCRFQVHPRVCGVLGVNPLDGRGQQGSSPRVRGFVTRGESTYTGVGFIPACAGF